MSDITNSDIRRAFAIKNFLSSEGLEIFKEKINDLRDSIQSEHDKLTKKVVTQDVLSEVNYLAGQRNALDQILWIEQELAEELENSPDEEGEQNTSSNQLQMR